VYSAFKMSAEMANEMGAEMGASNAYSFGWNANEGIHVWYVYNKYVYDTLSGPPSKKQENRPSTRIRVAGLAQLVRASVS